MQRFALKFFKKINRMQVAYCIFGLSWNLCRSFGVILLPVVKLGLVEKI